MKLTKNCLLQLKEEYKDVTFIQYLDIILKLNDNKIYDEIINEYIDMEEINADNFLTNYMEKDKSSININKDFYFDYILKDFTILMNKDNFDFIYLYKIEFSLNFFESILFDNLYEYMKKQYKIFINILNRGAIGGMFEILVDYYFKKNKKFLDIPFEQIISISEFVPNGYSIKYYSSIRKNSNFKLLNLKENENKEKIPFKNTYIIQKKFNGKYYDSGLLKATNIENVYDIIVTQESILKDKEKRFNKSEHELIMTNVKHNIENEYDIKINKSFFLYILSEIDNKN